MEPDRWKRIETVFHAALEQPPEERSRFLDSACENDPVLRHEVESLLSRDMGDDLEDRPPPLRPGTKLGEYEILSPLGRGGMGEVWRAKDTTLDRRVAIKTLPRMFARDPERLARFEREARLLASLNHPNIAVIHGLAAAEGTRFLILELIEGKTLDELIKEKPLPLDTSLKIALQLAEAIEAAHAKGIVHRDLKPANIKVTPDGTVKVLDFGLAKAVSGDRPILTANVHGEVEGLTQEGMIQGTPAYMSPEQVRGESVDAQADIWAFGCVLFEMLTRQPPFGTGPRAELFAKVLEREPDFDKLPDEAPSSVRRMIRRCLEKNARERLHHIGDARLDIREALSGAPIDVSVRYSRKRIGIWAAVAAAAIALAAFAGWHLSPKTEPQFVNTPIGLPVKLNPINTSGNRVMELSPDGRRIAWYGAGQKLSLQTLGRQDSTVIAEDISGSGNPFFSPHGDWVGFFALGTLMKVPTNGGSPIRIAAFSGGGAGGTWNRDQTIVFASATGLYRTSAEKEQEGEAELLVAPSAGQVYAWPQFLPDGNTVLLTVSQESVRASYTVLFDLTEKTLSAPLVRGAVGARYVEDATTSRGYLIYATSQGSLAAVAFDAKRREVLGDPVDIPETRVRIGGSYFAAAFSTSDTGTLVHIEPAPTAKVGLVWFDPRSGQEQAVSASLPEEGVGYPRVSPDGTHLAFEIKRPVLDTSTPVRRIWTVDLARGIPTRLSDVGNAIYDDFHSVWSPDSKEIFFGSRRTGPEQVFSHSADGAGSDMRLRENPDVAVPVAMIDDDRLVVMRVPYTEADIGILDLADPEKPVDWIAETPWSEVTPSVSPDRKWIAYASNESHAPQHYEIYVRRIGSGERPIPVSRNGGVQPLWGPEGSHALYYLAPNASGAGHTLVAATVELSTEFRVVGEREVLPINWVPSGLRQYDVHPDGRLLLPKALSNVRPAEAVVWMRLNWIEELNAASGED